MISSADSPQFKFYKKQGLQCYCLPLICRDFEPSILVAIFAHIISPYHFS